MKLIPNNTIQIFNYSPNPVAIKGTHREYLVPGARGMGPGVEFLPTEDVKYINGRSPVFKFGMLEFADDEREEIYAELNMPNWKETTLFERDIDTMLLHPTKESLQKIIDAPNVQTIERIRGHMIGLVNAGEDVSSRVIKLVDERTDEMRKHPTLPSKIKLVEKDYALPPSQEMESMRQEIEELKKLLLEKEKKETSAPTSAPVPAKPAAPRKPAATKKAPVKKTNS